VLALIYSVGHNDLVQCASVDTVDGVAAQDAVGDERVHLRRAFLLQQLRRAGDGVGGVREIVDKDSGAVRDVSDQHHGRVLPVVDLCGAAFFVNKGKRHAERIGNGSRTLGSASIRTDHDSLLVVGDVELDVFAEQVAAIQVVDGDVEEALVLWICSGSAYLHADQ
jgi:hypothetical protein